MNENKGGSNSLLDTTDCLEAVGVFKGWKNFLFAIVFICLLLLQISFWLVDVGWVKVQSNVVAAPPPSEPQAIDTTILEDVNIENPVDALGLTEPNEPAAAEEPNAPAVAEIQDAAPAADSQTTENDLLLGITFNHLVWVINISNAVLILAAILYCLTMLFSLSVSMLGRLGGINHITRAFFLSMLALVLLMPWHNIFGSMVIGSIYTPDELVTKLSAKTGDIFDLTLYYLRFCGYWVLILLLIILAQIRSCRWAGAILRRLEII